MNNRKSMLRGALCAAAILAGCGGGELLLLADATQPPALHPSETRFLLNRRGRAEAAEWLLLLHPADTRCPRGTREWLARRPVAGHLHVRPALERDMARLKSELEASSLAIPRAQSAIEEARRKIEDNDSQFRGRRPKTGLTP